MGTTAFARGALLLAHGIVYVLSSTPVLAETQKLSLPQVIEFSMKNNGNLTSFREEKGIREAGKTRAMLLPNPTIELEGGTGALTGSSNENNLALGVSQEFFLANKRDKRLAVAALELEMYRWQLTDHERVLREEVKTAFCVFKLVEQRIISTDRAVALNRQLLEVTQERLKAGDIPELEMNLVKVELARSEGAKIDAEKAHNQNQLRLWTLMGLSTGEYPEIVGTLETEIAINKSVADLKQLALQNRPDLKALETEKIRGEAAITLAQAEGIPNITAALAFKRDTAAMEIGGIEDKDIAYTIGLKLSMPIPLFDRNQAGVQEARAKRNSIASRLLAAARNVEREVETAYDSYLNSEKVLLLYKSNIIPQIEENLKLTQEAYRLGEIGILAIFQEQKKYSEVNDGYLIALHDRLAALAKLESAVATELTGGAQ